MAQQQSPVTPRESNLHALSIYMTDGEAIRIPFTTARLFNHRWRCAVVSVSESRVVIN